MKRFLITFILTIIIGAGIYFIWEKVKDQKKEDDPSNIKYIFDVSYAKKIEIAELENIINSKDEVIVMFGKKEQDSSAKLSTFLGEVVKDYGLEVYYIEKEEQLEASEEYQNFFKSDENLKYFSGFTPSLLVFQNGKLKEGYPGDAEYRNIVKFLTYCEVIEEENNNE